MATREQLIQALRKADAAGDTQAAQRFAQLIKGQPSTVMGARSEALTGEVAPEPVGGSTITQQMRDLPELQESGILSGQDKTKIAALAPVLLSTTNPDEIAQIVTSSFPDVGVTYNLDNQGRRFPILVNNKTGAATIINRPGISGMDVVQGLGLAAAFTPAGAASTIPKVAGASALTEGVIQAGQAAGGGEFDGAEVGLSALLGGAFKFGEEALSAGARVSRGTPESQLVREGEQAGVPVLTSDVLPPETFAAKSIRETGEKIPILGTGEIRAAQNKMRNEAVQDVADKYGEFSYDAIVTSLKDQKNKVKRAAGNVLEKTGNQLDELGEIPASRTFEAIESATAELSKPGVIKSQAALDDVTTLFDTLKEAPQTFSSLKENRTLFREIVKGADKAERSQLSTRSKSILESVERAMKADMTAFAKDNLDDQGFAKWQKANNTYAEEAKKLTKTRLKSILDKGDITPEVAENMIFSKKPSEVKSLYDSLGLEGKANAKSAIISRMISDASKRGGLSPNAFTVAMEKYSPQVKTFFKGEELKQLEGLQRVLRATARAQDASVTTPTGQALFTGGLGVSAATLPLETALVGGSIAGLTRLYESAPVRNALLRLASVPPRSKGYDVALREAVEAIEAGSQSLRSLEQEQLQAQ